MTEPRTPGERGSTRRAHRPDPYAVEGAPPPLAPTPPPPQAVVRAGHTPCPGCGYDLIGLPPDRPCPECGLAARFDVGDVKIEGASGPSALAVGRAAGIDRAVTDPVLLAKLQRAHRDRVLGAPTLAEAPPAVIRTIGGGFWLMAVAVTLAVVSPAAAFVPIGAHPLVVSCAVGLLAATLWLAGLIVATTPMPGADVSLNHGPLPGVPALSLRRIAAVTQSAWPLLMLVLLAAVVWSIRRAAGPAAQPIIPAPGPGAGAGLGTISPTQAASIGLSLAVTHAPLALPSVLFLTAAGLAGWMPTAWLLARYAQWARDDSLADSLRRAAVGMLIFGALAAINAALPSGLGGVVLIFAASIWCGLIASMLYMLYAVYVIAATCSAAASDARLRRRRDLRRVEKMQQEREAHARAARVAPDPEPPSLIHKIGVAPVEWDKKRR